MKVQRNPKNNNDEDQKKHNSLTQPTHKQQKQRAPASTSRIVKALTKSMPLEDETYNYPVSSHPYSPGSIVWKKNPTVHERKAKVYQPCMSTIKPEKSPDVVEQPLFSQEKSETALAEIWAALWKLRDEQKSNSTLPFSENDVKEWTSFYKIK